MTSQIGLIWEEGWDAYFAGKVLEDNPYDANSRKNFHDEWKRGWMMASEKKQ